MPSSGPTALYGVTTELPPPPRRASRKAGPTTAMVCGPFGFKEGLIKLGVWTSPQLIGTDTTDPLNRFAGDDLGFFRQGSLNVGLTREYAEFLAGTPGILARKDLIRKQFFVELMAAQFNADLLKLLRGLNVQAGHAVTTPSAKTLDLAFVGSDEPSQPRDGYLIETTLTNGKPLFIATNKEKIKVDKMEYIGLKPVKNRC